MKKVLFFFGTRPEAIKMAPVVKRFHTHKNFRATVVVSAQHRSMLDQVLKIFKLKSNYDLNIMKPGQSLFDISTKVLRGFEKILDRVKPDLVMVHGDTSTTLGGALAAYYKKVPIAHVEAGLRTYDKYRPFPEEMNRHLTDALADLHFSPTTDSRRALLKENISDKRIFVTGNTVIDALFETIKTKRRWESRRLGQLISRIQKKSGPVVLITAHRRENFGKPFQNIFNGIKELSRKFPHVHWIYPVHPNPNVKGVAQKTFSKVKNVHLMDPVGYSDMVNLLQLCKLVLTDSGGLQEEAPSLGKPVLVLREVTERPEAVKAGTVKLVGRNKFKLVRETSRLLTDKNYYRKMANAVNPYGDGKASIRILEATQWFFGITKSKPRPFERG